MLGLSDRQGRRREARSDAGPPGREAPFEVVSRRGKAYLRPAGATPRGVEARRAAPPEVAPLAPFAAGALMLPVLVLSTAAFMAAFSATFEAASRALPEGSLSAPRSDPARALRAERDRRLAALADYDRHAASAAADPPLQQRWRDLKRREIETIRGLEEHLAGLGP